MGIVSNQDEFASGLDDEIKAMTAAILAEAKDAATIVIEVAVPATPLVTGVHQGSWIVGVGSDPGPSGNQPDPGGAATIAKALAVIAEAQPGQNIIIVNDGPAAEQLDEGSSTQAPAGFSAQATDAAARGRP